MSWPRLTLLPPFHLLSVVLFFCWLGELSQLSKVSDQQKMQSKEGGRTTFSKPQAAEGSKLLDQFSCSMVCPPKHLTSQQAPSSNHKRAEPLIDASLQTSRHSAQNNASYVMQMLLCASMWHALLNYLHPRSPLYLKKVIVEGQRRLSLMQAARALYLTVKTGIGELKDFNKHARTAKRQRWLRG